MDSLLKKQLLGAGAILVILFTILLDAFWRDMVWTRTEAKVVSSTMMCRHSHYERRYGRRRYSLTWLRYPKVVLRCDDQTGHRELVAEGYNKVRQFSRAIVTYPLADGRLVQSSIDIEPREISSELGAIKLFPGGGPRLKPGAMLPISYSPWSPEAAEFAPYTHERRLLWGLIFLFGSGVIFVVFAAGFLSETQEEADFAHSEREEAWYL